MAKEVEKKRKNICKTFYKENNKIKINKDKEKKVFRNKNGIRIVWIIIETGII